MSQVLWPPHTSVIYVLCNIKDARYIILDSLLKMDAWKETNAMMLKIKEKTILAFHQNIYLMRITCKCVVSGKQERIVYLPTRLQHNFAES